MPRLCVLYLKFVFAPLLLISFVGESLALAEVAQVPRDYATISLALESVPAGSVIELAAGAYREALFIDKPLTLRAVDAGEALLIAGDDQPVITISDTDSVTIEGLRIRGGEYGIYATRSDNVSIRDNVVTEARLTGIKVRLGAADIINNTVIQTRAPYGMGIHVTNTMEWATSRVIGNIVVANARSGIYTNMTGMIEIADNIVRDNGEHGIAVTEMSHADVVDNIVAGNRDSGIHLLDMSMARICNNIIAETQGAEAAHFRRGNGIMVDFHSEAVLASNTVQGSARHGISVLYGSSAWLHENHISGSVAGDVFSDESVVRDGEGCVEGD